MVATTEVLDTLKTIGLNLYERKIFVALLAKGIATAAEVSEIAGVPRSRSYDILESLAEKGFVVVQPSKPIKYVAMKPSEAMEKTKEILKRKHDDTIERIDKLKGSKILEELEGIYSKGFNLVRPSEMTGTFKGKFTINRQLRSIFRDAKKEINILTTEDGLNDLYQNHFRVLKKVAKKGVKLRVLAPLRDSETEKALGRVAELRGLEEPLGRFCIIDNKHVLMSLTDDKETDESQYVSFWASSPNVAENVAGQLFSRLWESGS